MGHSQNMIWRDDFVEQLPLLGHRNWVVIADAAFPQQCSTGMKMLYADAPLMDVATDVLTIIKQAKHIRSRIMTDLELDALDDVLCPGVESLRRDLDRLVAGHGGRLPVLHEDILKQMSEVGKTYTILMIKTPMTIPYTSVFIDLQCGYWTDSAEAQLRARIVPAHRR